MIECDRQPRAGKQRPPWLDSNHTFSFNRYYDPRFTGFRDLLVINEDYVAPESGFSNLFPEVSLRYDKRLPYPGLYR